MGKIAPRRATIIASTILFWTAGAHADQAADLGADQRLLDARITELANIGQNSGASPVFSVDQNPAGVPAVGGSFPRSILLPGTETSMKISGWISEHLDYWLTGGPPNGLQTNNTGATGTLQSIPLRDTVGSARSNGIFSQTPSASRFVIETRTPTALGEARTVMAWDWAGSNAYVPGGAGPIEVSNNLVPRLFSAYATLGGLLAGQANSNFRDSDAEAEVVEFGGNTGGAGHTRVPQLRYTAEAGWGEVSVSAEAPTTDLGTPAGVVGADAGSTSTITTSCPTTASISTPSASTCTSTLLTSGQLPTNIAKSTAPDLTTAYYVPQSWGHFDISAVLRPGLDVTDGRYIAKSYVGFGGHIGLDVKPRWFGWTKDDITLDVTGGSALGSYLNSSTNFALATNYGAAGKYGSFNGPTTAAAAALVSVEPTTEFGTEMGYQHWWLDNLRSNISGGILHHDIPVNLVGATQAASMNKELMTAHANVIWNPVSFVDVGFEYMWGKRRVVNNQTGTENVLINKYIFRF